MQQEAVSEEEKVNEAVEDTESKETEEAKETSGGKDDKKKKKADKKEQAYEEKIAELNDRVMRQMAEFDNYRKRTEKEKSQMFEIGAKDIIEKVLPVVDNFERGLSALSEEEKESAFAQGIEKIYKQLTQVLTDAGVEPIEAVGKEFNPDFHNAVMHAEDENLGENIVAEEFQKGYTYKGSVVRHSMVKVVN
ncbi:MAG: nucleotide exchange factor GrpE [Lachnospiraceae bacterium]|nr:nucleotide exchange factor GrpE [Lachnospiraceae bacterium]